MRHHPNETHPHAVRAARELAHRNDDLEQAAGWLRAMAHPMRLKLLCALGDEECGTRELLERVGSTPTNIALHLGVLLNGGLVSRRRRGNRHLYRVRYGRTMELIHAAREVFCPRRSQHN